MKKNEIQHVIIRKSDYVSGTHEKPEVNIFVQTRKIVNH